jgi:Pyruvate/2-oxoacid:ferredoxin oxidoreductase delta subunit
MSGDNVTPRIWLLSHPATGDSALAARWSELAALLQAAGQVVVTAPPLYHLPEDDPRWAQWRALAGPIVAVLDLHPRPGEWLLRRQGVGQGGLQVIDLRTLTSARQALAEWGLAPAGEPATAAPLPAPEPLAAERWYPVLDKSRCTECRHCLQFCLFGVYELDPAGKVRVARPDECKAGCPACARVCPHSAIMFPLYDRDAGISGAPGELVQREADDRRLYYERTGLPCPVCSSLDQAGVTAHPDGVCPECGRVIAAPAGPLSATHDEIDALIDELDNLTRGRDS